MREEIKKTLVRDGRVVKGQRPLVSLGAAYRRFRNGRLLAAVIEREFEAVPSRGDGKLYRMRNPVASV